MNALVVAWLAEIGLITWERVSKDKRPPFPSEVVATFVIFGAFSLVRLKNERVGDLLGWGMVVATALNVFDPTTLGTKNPSVTFKTGALGDTQNGPTAAPVQSAGQLANPGQAGGSGPSGTFAPGA